VRSVTRNVVSITLRSGDVRSFFEIGTANILLNCIDLTWMYSLSQGRLVFPKLHESQTVSTSGAILKGKKKVLLQLKRVLENRARISNLLQPQSNPDDPVP